MQQKGFLFIYLFFILCRLNIIQRVINADGVFDNANQGTSLYPIGFGLEALVTPRWNPLGPV